MFPEIKLAIQLSLKKSLILIDRKEILKQLNIIGSSWITMLTNQKSNTQKINTSLKKYCIAAAEK